MTPELDALSSCMGSVLAHIVTELYDDAISDLNKIIRLDPKDAFAYNMRGDAYGFRFFLN